MSENEIRLECLKLVFMQRRWADFASVISEAQKLEAYVVGDGAEFEPRPAYEFEPTTAGFPEN